MKEKKARVEDALHATRAAVEEGIVPGGGVALHALPSPALEKRQGRRRRAGRRQHRPPRARGAAPPDRATTPASRARSSSRRSRRREGDVGYNAADRRVRGHGRGRHHRPDQGGAIALQNAASVAGLHAHHRGIGGPAPRRRQAGAALSGRRHVLVPAPVPARPAARGGGPRRDSAATARRRRLPRRRRPVSFAGAAADGSGARPAT